MPDIPDPDPWVPVAISIFAALVASIALWRTHLQRFRLYAVTGELALGVYPIRSEGERWHILSAEVPMTLTNAGARPGRVRGLRLNVRFPEVKARRQRFPLGARFVLENDDRALREEGRFAWLDSATTLWRPRVLLPKESVTQTVIFEARIEQPIVATIRFRLEAYTRPRRIMRWRAWRSLATWDFAMSPSIFSELSRRVEAGGFSVHPRSAPRDDGLRPADLLEHVSFPADRLPAGPFAAPSYLDYPPEEETAESAPSADGEDMSDDDGGGS